MKNKTRLAGKDISWEMIGDELHVDCSDTGIDAVVITGIANMADEMDISFYKVVLSGPIRLNYFATSQKKENRTVREAFAKMVSNALVGDISWIKCDIDDALRRLVNEAYCVAQEQKLSDCRLIVESNASGTGNEYRVVIRTDETCIGALASVEYF